MNSKLGGISLDIRILGEVNLLTHRDGVVCLEDESQFCLPLNSFKRTGSQTKGNRIQRELSVFINFQLALLPVLFFKVALDKQKTCLIFCRGRSDTHFDMFMVPVDFKMLNRNSWHGGGRAKDSAEALPPAGSHLGGAENAE